MATKNRQVDVTVKYIPDVSELKGAMTSLQSVKFDINGKDAKNQIVRPVEEAMKEINKAISSGASSQDLVKLFERADAAAEGAQKQIHLMMENLNAGFSSAGNQQLLDQLEKYKKEIQKVKKLSDQWDADFGNKTLTRMRSGLELSGASDARKELSDLQKRQKLGQELTNQEILRLQALNEYVETLNKRNLLLKQGISKGSYEKELSYLNSQKNEVLSNVQTGAQNIQGIKELSSSNSYLEQFRTGLSKVNTETVQFSKNVQKQTEEAKKHVRDFGDVFAGTFLGTSINNIFEDALQRGIQFFKEYDSTLTRTMMVTGMTRDEVNQLTESYNDLANELSSTTKDVAAAQLVFYQQGLNTQDSLAMTEASIAISKTGEIAAGEAADRLTAAVRGYQLAATDAMDIADKMSALDAAAASSVDELTVAMQKSASQARMAGLDLDYYMAYLSTMQEVTREARKEFWRASSIKNILQKPLFIV